MINISINSQLGPIMAHSRLSHCPRENRGPLFPLSLEHINHNHCSNIKDQNSCAVCICNYNMVHQVNTIIYIYKITCNGMYIIFSCTYWIHMGHSCCNKLKDIITHTLQLFRTNTIRCQFSKTL